jgi:hypothetical protein
MITSRAYLRGQVLAFVLTLPVGARTLTDVAAPAPARDTDGAVLDHVVAVLAAGGAQVEALRLVLRTMPALRSLTLRTAPGQPVVAAAVQSTASAAGSTWALDVPVRRDGEWTVVLAAVSDEPVTPEHARVLRGLAGALSLVTTAAMPDPDVAARAVLDAEADLALVAAELAETVAESLVALRHTDPAQVRDAATAALAEVRRIARDLRAAALGDGLRFALHALRERGATVCAEDPALDLVPPAVAVIVERVAEAVCRQAAGSPRITAFMEDSTVKLRVESADNAVDASELERWRRRAHALRGELRHSTGGVELSLPAATGHEGRHDDGPDL